MATTTAARSDREEETRARAARLVERAFVLNATEAPVSQVEGRTFMNFSGLMPLSPAIIEDYRRQGYNAVLIPYAFFDLENMAPVQDTMTYAMRVFARWNTFVAAHAHEMMLITERESFDRARESGRIGLIVGSHNAGELFRTVDDIDLLYQEVGLRHGLLTLFGQNRLGTAVDEDPERDAGLTRFGRAVIERMNRVGMAVDVSHCGLKTRRDMLDASAKPVLISHGNSAAICPTPRNNSDEMLKALADTGGVIGLMFWRPMVRAEEPVTVEHVLDHFDHVCQLIGPRHVGLGLETPMVGFDACENAMGVARNVSYLGNLPSMDIPELCGRDRVRTLVEGLIRRGYGDEDITGILGGNFERAFREIFTT